MQSFEFTGLERVNKWGATVKQIRATRDIPINGVRKGDIGGWIESAAHLSGDAWVSGDAQVFGNAQVYGNAQVSGDARLYDNARLSGNAQVSGNARLYGNAQVSGDAWVSGNARLSGNAQVSGNAWVSDNAQLSGNAWVSDNAQLSGNARLYGDARLYGNAQASGNARLYGNAQVFQRQHVLTVDSIGSEGVAATLMRAEGGKHILVVGCWTGTLDTLMAEVKRRRANWRAEEATQELWEAQYQELKALGKTIVAQWNED